MQMWVTGRDAIKRTATRQDKEEERGEGGKGGKGGGQKKKAVQLSDSAIAVRIRELQLIADGRMT